MTTKIILIPVISLFLAMGNQATAQTSNSRQPLEREPQTAEDINKLAPEDTYSLPWGQITETNILWKKRVWREIDINEAGNEAFQHKPDAPDFANMLMGAIGSGTIKAYDAEDGGRFSKEFSSAQFTELMTGGNSPANNFSPEKVIKYRFKEDWLFLEKEHKMVVRIIGIAPVMKVTNPDGTSSEQEVFWLYYPNIRNFLAQHPANTGDAIKKLNWDELFESRNFKSKIVKVSETNRPWVNDKNITPSGK